MAERTCSVCDHFRHAPEPDNPAGGTRGGPPPPLEGECHRHAPRPGDWRERATWPLTLADDVCGEWRPLPIVQGLTPGPSAPSASAAVCLQPAPLSTAGPDVLALLAEDVLARRLLGKERYGTVLTPDNGRDHLVDALQEAIDLAAYLKAEILRREQEVAT